MRQGSCDKMIGGRFEGGWEARVRGAHDMCAQIYDVPIHHQDGPHYQSNLSDRAASLKKMLPDSWHIGTMQN